MRRIAVFLALLLTTLTVASPAQAGAGGWAATYLDPVPAAFSPGGTYTIGMWMLQHGTHPYSGSDLGTVGLKFTDGKKTLSFTAVQLREPAHYATAISLPAGTWRVQAVQGWFAPFEVGTLKVPGGLAVKPLEPRIKSMLPRFLEMNGGKDPWGAIRPPGFPPAKHSAAPVSQAVESASPAAVKPAALGVGLAATTTSAAVVEPAAPWWRSPYGLALAVLAGSALTLLAVRLRRR